ncbi:hypothetical protein M3936_23515 [Sutcliffiella horikoshii]|uniref:hypothetical protein n=1 Tax=Sutcliffiella horikoshii TaxID=79883 RepID=UPI0007D09664|nr:hypothetical protein [Sutcliffiella horikoshii]MCM3620527.1 hypothetical protein [Sutcliffiella horikoshii]
MVNLHNRINEVMEMIYMSNKGELSKRRVKVLSVQEDAFRAYCFVRKQQRTFKMINVLSIRPVRSVRRGA